MQKNYSNHSYENWAGDEHTFAGPVITCDNLRCYNNDQLECRKYILHLQTVLRRKQKLNLIIIENSCHSEVIVFKIYCKEPCKAKRMLLRQIPVLSFRIVNKSILISYLLSLHGRESILISYNYLKFDTNFEQIPIFSHSFDSSRDLLWPMECNVKKQDIFRNSP